MSTNPALDPIVRVLSEAKRLAKEYRQLTGKPLGITGEVAEYEAWRLLGVELAPARSPGFDAIETVDGVSRRLQIKGRCLLSKKQGQRIGKIDLTKAWDAVLLVLLDEDLEATAIYEADREAIAGALTAPGSRARNERGALAVSKFRAISVERWHRLAVGFAMAGDPSVSRDRNRPDDGQLTDSPASGAIREESRRRGMTASICTDLECGLLHDNDGVHAGHGWARGARRALDHKSGECPAFDGVAHAMVLCPLVSDAEKKRRREAAEAAIARSSVDQQ